MVKIRKAKKDDLQGVYEVFLDLLRAEDDCACRIAKDAKRFRKRRLDFERSAKKDLLSDIIDRKKRYIIAEIDKEIVGYALGCIPSTKDNFFVLPKTGYFNSLVVRKKYRGEGIASNLHAAMLKWFKEKKCSSVSIEVFVTNPAVNMYERWGYKGVVQKMNKKLT
ncbi:GNAT family N-acetyltransferase [Candidatus Woesearchaeota archaeon]|nr:GNAT family N-acetyltransferase [Candidatus Woesearchaeota archaeon]